MQNDNNHIKENFSPIEDDDAKVVPGGPEEQEFDPDAFIKMETPKEVVDDTEILESDTEVAVVDGATEIEATKEEKAEMKDPADFDPEYLEYSSEAVGFESREQQWDTYRVIANYIPEEDSVLDFGCARGDFERFYQTEFKADLDYLGVDFNQQLIDAGKKVYNDEVDLMCADWFNLSDDETADWCMNINSSNLRYDADTTKNDMEYLQATIKQMYKHAEKGLIVLLTSDMLEGDGDGLINWNPGDIFNWAQKEFGGVAIDHTFSDGTFTIIIYKN